MFKGRCEGSKLPLNPFFHPVCRKPADRLSFAGRWGGRCGPVGRQMRAGGAANAGRWGGRCGQVGRQMRAGGVADAGRHEWADSTLLFLVFLALCHQIPQCTTFHIAV